jgi:hypothetical protein
MMPAWILDAAGFVTGMFDGPGQPVGSTQVPPPENAALPLRFVDGAWSTAPSGPPATWDDAPAEYFWVDVGPFFDRFGEKALVITSSEDPEVKGLVTLLLPRKYVDLKRPDLPRMMGLLVAKALITAAEYDAALVLQTEEYERHIKGLPQPAAPAPEGAGDPAATA